MLLALAAASECGFAISAFDIIPNLFYPFLLAVTSIIYIIISKKDTYKNPFITL